MWLPSDITRIYGSSMLQILVLAKELKWGTWALVSLYISLGSGIIVGIQYEYATPFFSSASIDLLVPFGRFFRSLHFYSSQFFFFLVCFHLLAVYHKSESYRNSEWLRLTATLPVILLLLFTGYVLRGDNTGASAGAIAENIIEAIPFVGTSLNNLLFSIFQNGFRKVYLHHVISLDLALLMLAWNHLRIYRIQLRNHGISLLAMIIFSIFIAAPLEPEQLGITYISGPWFFLGLQELLRYFPPLFAGVILPCSFLLLLFYIHPRARHKNASLWLIAVWLLGYAIFSLIAWSR